MTRGWIYFIASDFADSVKIGFSTKPEARLRDIDSASAVPVRIVWMYEADAREERALHRRFAAHRERWEWFHFHADIRSFICELRARGVGVQRRPTADHEAFCICSECTERRARVAQLHGDRRRNVACFSRRAS